MRRLSHSFVSLTVVLTLGCGSSDTPVTETKPTPDGVERTAAAETPTSNTSVSDTPALATARPAPGTPQELLLEVVKLTATQIQAPEGALTPVSATAVAKAERSRQNEIVQLSMEVIAQTHDKPDQEQLFNNAVHYLSDARLKLALEGDTESEQELVNNADALFERDATSLAAVEANAKLVELARARAERDASTPWAEAYANQARLFATRFAHEPNRAAVTLLDAARWCERRGYNEPAILCYRELKSSFGTTLFASQADGPIRRLGMLGLPLGEFGGPTIDGGTVRREHYNGQPMVVVFWDSRDPDLAGTMTELEQARRARTDVDIALIGVCLDEDERAAAAAIESLPQCPQIYSPDPSERGRNNPLARYYGVQDTPTIWLIGSGGIVESLDAIPSDVATLR